MSMTIEQQRQRVEQEMTRQVDDLDKSMLRKMQVKSVPKKFKVMLKDPSEDICFGFYCYSIIYLYCYLYITYIYTLTLRRICIFVRPNVAKTEARV